MAFDDLISILLILLFLVVPLVRGAMRSGRGRSQPPPPGPGGDAPGDATASRGRGAAASGEASTATRPRPQAGSGSSTSSDAPSGPTGSFDDEIQRMLERARRRVAEAEGGPQGRRDTSTASTPSESASSTSASQASRASGSASTGSPQGRSGPFTPAGGRSAAQRRSLVDGDDLGSPFLGREGDEARSAQATADRLRNEERARRRKRASKAPKVVTRRPGASGPSSTLPHAVDLDRASIVDGFIWHQVLSKPVAKRRRSGPPRRHHPTRD